MRREETTCFLVVLLKVGGAAAAPESSVSSVDSAEGQVEVGERKVKEMTQRELLDRGVLIRDVGLLGYLRVTIGNEAENKRFIESLSACLWEM